MGSRTIARLLALVVTAWSLLLVLPAPAEAHAYLVRTDPADGTTLRHAPGQLTLSFSEHVVLEATRVSIVDGDGRAHPVRGLRLETADTGDTEAPATIVVPLPRLADNSYRVSWETLSSDDLHATRGYFVFGVGRPVHAGAFTEPVPRLEESSLRWALLLGVALVLGTALLDPAVARHPALAAGRRRQRRLALAGALLALAASLLLLLDQASPSGLTPGRLLASGYGARWGWREAGLLALAAAMLGERSGTARRWRRGLLVAGALLTVTGTAALGHAAAGGPTRLLATSAHVLAVTAWSGGVLALLALLGARPASVRPVAELRDVLRSFARPAAACAAIAVVSGIYLASSVVVSVDAAVGTTYGRTLLLKTGLVALMGVAGLVNHRRARGRHDLDVPRRSVAVEALLGVAALAAAGVLAAGQPATEPAFLAPPAPTAGPLAGEVHDLQEAVDVRPNVPGRNVTSVAVFETRRPSPGPVTGVDLGLGRRTVAATPIGDGHWTATLDDVPAGTTVVEVTVHRAGLPDTTWRRPWVVGHGTPGRHPVVSNAPVAGALRALDAALVVLLGTGAVLLLRTRRRRRSAVAAPSPEPAPALTR